MHCFVGLNPRLNVIVNGFLAILWCLSWSLLTWYMSGTLRNMCDVEHWREAVGIMVCRIYKALFSFTLLGMYVKVVLLLPEVCDANFNRLSTLSALALDIYVRRQQTRRGIYRLQDLDTKPHPEATRGPFTEGTSYSQGGLAEPRESEAWEAPRPSTGPYGEQSNSSSPHALHQGYSVPDNQFDYDTGYRGGHEQRAYGHA